jgi:hypothetical protein
LSKKITLQLFFITLNAEKAEAKKEKKKKTSLGISLMMHFQSSDGGYLLK